MDEDPRLTDMDLDAIVERAATATPGPWKAFVEGRDHQSGDDFIRTGGTSDSAPDMYVSQYLGTSAVKVSAADLDFIAEARQDVPRLIAALRPQPLTLIGYWRSDQHPELPDPHEFVFPGAGSDVRDRLASALENGARVRFYMGYSECRICGALNGSAELTDGVHIWPEGLVHYVREHSVALPHGVTDALIRRYEELELSERDAGLWLRLTEDPVEAHPAWALLRSLDDATALERPADFDLATETDRAHRLTNRLSATFRWQITTDAGSGAVQDASFLGDVVVPADAGRSNAQVVIRLSNFGRLAVVAVEGFGIYDESEREALLDELDRSRVQEALREEGYVEVPEFILWRESTASQMRFAPPTNTRCRRGGSATSTTSDRGDTA